MSRTPAPDGVVVAVRETLERFGVFAGRPAHLARLAELAAANGWTAAEVDEQGRALMRHRPDDLDSVPALLVARVRQLDVGHYREVRAKWAETRDSFSSKRGGTVLGFNVTARRIALEESGAATCEHRVSRDAYCAQCAAAWPRMA